MKEEFKGEDFAFIVRYYIGLLNMGLNKFNESYFRINLLKRLMNYLLLFFLMSHDFSYASNQCVYVFKASKNSHSLVSPFKSLHVIQTEKMNLEKKIKDKQDLIEFVISSLKESDQLHKNTWKDEPQINEVYKNSIEKWIKNERPSKEEF